MTVNFTDSQYKFLTVQLLRYILVVTNAGTFAGFEPEPKVLNS